MLCFQAGARASGHEPYEGSRAPQPSDGRQLAEPLASASFSEHFVSGYNVVWVALVFGKTLINYGAMSIAQRHGRWIRSEAFPDQFDEAQPLLDRELEDFSNIGITHDSKPTTNALRALTGNRSSGPLFGLDHAQSPDVAQREAVGTGREEILKPGVSPAKTFFQDFG